ncbi:MAG: AAA family ATPase [Nocardioides sp.]
MICVLVVASGAGWESEALRTLGDQPGVVVLKRCVDVDDLLAAATAGKAQVAVVALDAPGLDAPAVEHLRRHRVRPVAVVAGGGADADQGRMRAHRIGIATLLDESDLARLGETVTAEDVAEVPGPIEQTPIGDQPPLVGPSRVVAVWGPQGAPGRTTVATGIAGALAQRGVETVLVDADPYGGAVAQQLGVLDEVSGLLSAARLASSGLLTERLATVSRVVGPHLSVVTGLPRPDRWIEIRPGTVEHLVEALRETATVVVDTGFCLDEDPGTEFGARPGRNSMTLLALSVADEVIVVGTSDPVGLSRLARALVDLREVLGGTPVRVVVNRSRSSLGWSEKDIGGMVEGFARTTGLHFLPDDRAATDRALVAGRTLAESGDSALGRELALLAAAVVPPSPGAAAPGRLRRRRAGRGHRR